MDDLLRVDDAPTAIDLDQLLKTIRAGLLEIARREAGDFMDQFMEDTVTFVEPLKIQDNEIKMNYRGKVTGDDMKLTVEFNRNEMEMTAKRVP